MKIVPNIITLLRILLSPVLLLLEPLTTEFFLFYFICGISDIFDGFIARRFSLTSKIGSILDSIADIILVSIVVYILLPIIEVPRGVIILVILIILIRLVSLIVVYFKYHTFAILHTYSNKVTGVLLFCFPFLYNHIGIGFLAYTLGIAGSISAIEELIIHITSPVLQRERKSIFANKYI